MTRQITINGVAVELARGSDWKGHTTYFATVDGVRRSFDFEHWAVEWVRQALQAIHRRPSVSPLGTA